jgi:hypothetical protein
MIALFFRLSRVFNQKKEKPERAKFEASWYQYVTSSSSIDSSASLNLGFLDHVKSLKGSIH